MGSLPFSSKSERLNKTSASDKLLIIWGFALAVIVFDGRHFNAVASNPKKEGATLNLNSILSELKSHRKRIDHAIAALEGTAVTASKEVAQDVATTVKKTRRRVFKMSAEARKRISNAKKKWWAKRKRLKLG